MDKRIESVMTKINKQVPIFEKLKRKEMTIAAAAAALGVSTRQVVRKLKVFRQEGPKGLIHKNFGKPSPKKLETRKKNRIVKIIKEKYADFGPTFASEKLAEEHNINMHPEVLRRLMISEDLWQKRRKKVRISSIFICQNMLKNTFLSQ